MTRHHLVMGLCSNRPFVPLWLRIHNACCHRNCVIIGGSSSGKLIKAHFAHSVAEILCSFNKNERTQDGGVFVFSLKYYKMLLCKNVTKWKNKVKDLSQGEKQVS